MVNLSLGYSNGTAGLEDNFIQCSREEIETQNKIKCLRFGVEHVSEITTAQLKEPLQKHHQNPRCFKSLYNLKHLQKKKPVKAEPSTRRVAAPTELVYTWKPRKKVEEEGPKRSDFQNFMMAS